MILEDHLLRAKEPNGAAGKSKRGKAKAGKAKGGAAAKRKRR